MFGIRYIALEQQRTELVDRRVENERKESQARADALRAMLQLIKAVDWRTLMAAQSGGLDSRQLIAMAFRDLADNADKVGSLNDVQHDRRIQSQRARLVVP